MRRLAWLLWLLIALLPLRGIAMGTFAPMDQPPPVSATPEQPPCPLHAATPDDAATPASACALCDVCHLVAMPVADVDAAPGTKPQAAPHPASGLSAGRAPAEGLFRPPR